MSNEPILVPLTRDQGPGIVKPFVSSTCSSAVARARHKPSVNPAGTIVPNGLPSAPAVSSAFASTEMVPPLPAGRSA